MGGMVEGGYQEADISRCKTFLEALGVCIQVSRVKRTDANLAVSSGIHPAQFSRIRQGKAHLPTDKIPVIEKLCGNTAITQWLASQHGAVLKVKTPDEIIREQAEVIAQLRAEKAA